MRARIFTPRLAALVAASGISLSCAAMAERPAAPTDMIVAVPVADVRSQPKAAKGGYAYDPLEETQVLEGERVTVLEWKGRWARVACPQQEEFTHHNRW